MNHPTHPTRLMPSRPLTERVAAFRDVVRARADSFSARWSEDRASIRQARAFDDIVELDAHMLKDIGAPSWLVSRAIARRDAQHGRLRDTSVTTLTHVGGVRWWARLLMLAGIVILAAPVWITSAALNNKSSVQAPIEGVFTGEFVHGVPVYRLASITVSAPRNLESARSTAQPRNAPRVSRAAPVVVTGAGRSPS